MDSIEFVSIWIETEKDCVPSTQIRIDVHHSLLFTCVIGMTEFIDLNDDTMRSIINKNIGAIMRTASVDAFITLERNRILEV